MKTNRGHVNNQITQANPPGYRPKAGSLMLRTKGEKPVHRPHAHRQTRYKNQPWPLAWVIVLDIFLVGAGLIVFALFHHVIPRDVGMTGEVLPQQAITTASQPAGRKEGSEPVDPLTGKTDGSYSTIAANTQGTTSATGEVKPSTSGNATPVPVHTGIFAEKFKDKFTSGEVRQTADSYQSANVSITVSKVQSGKAAYVVTDIYVRDIQYFKTAFANGQYARGVTDTVPSIASANKAVAAISGDYYGIRDKGIVIRNGTLYRKTPYRDVLIMNHDGSMQTFTAAAFDMDAVLKNGAWQGWSFGPMLLMDGQPMTTFNSDVNPANPRGAIGYYEPGHYCFVLVDGRQPGYSEGMTLKQLSQLFYELGCTVAYNLDGGQSAVLTFMDQIMNVPYKGGREISDIIYVADD